MGEIYKGEAPGTLRVTIIEDESTWDNNKIWWRNPKISGLERHLDGRRQAIITPPRQQTSTNYSFKFKERLGKIFGEDIELRVNEEYPNYYLEIDFEDVTYYSQIHKHSDIVDIYHRIKDFWLSEEMPDVED